MPPLPPAAGHPCRARSSRASADQHFSVVSIIRATDAAFCQRQAVTLVGSRRPHSAVAELTGAGCSHSCPCLPSPVEDHRGSFTAFPHLRRRLFDGALEDAMPTVLVFIRAFSFSSASARDQRHAAARHHAFVHRRTRGVQGVLNSAPSFPISFMSTSVPHRPLKSRRRRRIAWQALLELLLVVSEVASSIAGGSTPTRPFMVPCACSAVMIVCFPLALTFWPSPGR